MAMGLMIRTELLLLRLLKWRDELSFFGKLSKSLTESKVGEFYLIGGFEDESDSMSNLLKLRGRSNTTKLFESVVSLKIRFAGWNVNWFSSSYFVFCFFIRLGDQ